MQEEILQLKLLVFWIYVKNVVDLHQLNVICILYERKKLHNSNFLSRCIS